MQAAAHAVERALAGVSVHRPRFPVVSNADATPNSDESRIPGLLVRQVDHPVLWEQSVRRLVELGATRALEIGPGQVLSGLTKRIAKTLPVLSVGDPAGIRKIAEFLEWPSIRSHFGYLANSDAAP
jgi:[acyl-carrier-protein] S-malonyltransferase